MQIIITNSPDFSKLSTMHADCFAKNWSERDFAEMFDFAGTFAIIAEQGFAVIRILFDEAEIITVGVEKSARKQGVAAKIVAQMLEFVTQKQVANIFLEVRKSNIAAINLYQKFDFKIISTRKNYYHNDDGTSEDAIMMRF